MSLPYTIKKGASGPPFQGHCKEPDGTYPNLTGATIKFRLRHENGTLLVNDAAMTVVDLPTAEVKFDWNTATPESTPAGRCRGEVEVVFSSGKKQVYPSRGHIEVFILERV